DSGNLSLLDSSGATLESVPLAGSFVTSDFSMSEASPNFFDSGGDTPTTHGAAAPWSTPNDYNDDGISDVLWRNNSTESLATWLMNGSAITSGNNVTSDGSTVTPDSTWSVAGTGDFNGDGTADVLWRQSTTGSLVT